MKIRTLNFMNEYIREVIGDDNITDYWNDNGIPDGSTLDDIKELADDDESFAEMCHAFIVCLKLNEE